MKTWHKCLIGGLGAATPLIMSLYFAEWDVVTESFSMIIFLGYLTKVIILLFVGGLVGFFYKTEESAIKLFQLGIAAPSIILGLINGQVISESNINDGNKVVQTSIISLGNSSTFKSNCYNLNLQDTTNVYQYKMPKESKSEEFWRGFTGKKLNNNWFLIYNTYENIHEAKQVAADLVKEKKCKHAMVYKLDDEKNIYQVVVGEFITYEEGKKLKETYKSLGKELILYEHFPKIK
jgi:hypothetical protein